MSTTIYDRIRNMIMHSEPLNTADQRPPSLTPQNLPWNAPEPAVVQAETLRNIANSLNPPDTRSTTPGNLHQAFARTIRTKGSRP